MQHASDRPTWQLPPGVSRGAWDYVTDTSIATQYDEFHRGHPLLSFDQNLIRLHLDRYAGQSDNDPKLAIDFGCGTGRNLMTIAERSWRVLGVDLSQSMLTEFVNKSRASQLPQDRFAYLRANMVSLECLQARIADAVLCMYSSMGMIQSRLNRLRFLSHVARILSPQGLFFVHVHNRGSWLRDPGGVRQTVRDWIRSKTNKSWELGDRIYPYRGLPSMFLHIYTERELRRDLRDGGLVLENLYRLNRHSSELLQGSWLAHLRSGGFLAVCRSKK